MGYPMERVIVRLLLTIITISFLSTPSLSASSCVDCIYQNDGGFVCGGNVGISTACDVWCRAFCFPAPDGEPICDVWCICRPAGTFCTAIAGGPTELRSVEPGAVPITPFFDDLLALDPALAGLLRDIPANQYDVVFAQKDPVCGAKGLSDVIEIIKDRPGSELTELSSAFHDYRAANYKSAGERIAKASASLHQSDLVEGGVYPQNARVLDRLTCVVRNMALDVLEALEEETTERDALRTLRHARDTLEQGDTLMRRAADHPSGLEASRAVQMYARALSEAISLAPDDRAFPNGRSARASAIADTTPEGQIVDITVVDHRRIERVWAQIFEDTNELVAEVTDIYGRTSTVRVFWID